MDLMPAAISRQRTSIGPFAYWVRAEMAPNDPLDVRSAFRG